MLTLHGYWRSGTAYRTRIALNLKGVPYRQVPLDLRRGEHRAASFLALQPQGLVPAVETPSGTLIQSGAIIEWLDEAYPEPALLPAAPGERAIVRAMAAIVGCDIHLLNNLRVLNALRSRFGAGDAEVNAWIEEWISAGFDALENLVATHGGTFAFRDEASLADIYLVPQAYAAERFGIALDAWPHLARVIGNARLAPAFAMAAPELQPDAD